MEVKGKIFYVPADQMTKGSQVAALNLLILLKAAVGIEPTNKGFADSKSLFG
jgi:hypothetical protein